MGQCCCSRNGSSSQSPLPPRGERAARAERAALLQPDAYADADSVLAAALAAPRRLSARDRRAALLAMLQGHERDQQVEEREAEEFRRARCLSILQRLPVALVKADDAAAGCE